MNPDDRNWLSDRFDQIDSRLDRMDARSDAIERDIQKRVRALETWRAFMTGAIAVVSAAITWIASVLSR